MTMSMMMTRPNRGAPQPNPPAENPDGTVTQPGSGHRAVGQLFNGFQQIGRQEDHKKINGPVSIVVGQTISCTGGSRPAVVSPLVSIKACHWKWWGYCGLMF
jgi:hypothetical protein